MSPVVSLAPAPSRRKYVSASLLSKNSLTAYGPKRSASREPNLVSKSVNDPIVTGTKAGPLSAVPMTPAGVPVTEVCLDDKSISCSKKPGERNVCSAIVSPRAIYPFLKYYAKTQNSDYATHYSRLL